VFAGQRRLGDRALIDFQKIGFGLNYPKANGDDEFLRNAIQSEDFVRLLNKVGLTLDQDGVYK